ncbi:hypothetical protein AAVH_05978 [Aphelenchoides avenae]|nr:hypothetical protein AAVH_05978 [Aphelenchus avenae]
MAESLGSEGNVAVFQHSSGEECFLKPVRYDVNESWKLVLLWIDSSSFKWQLASGPVEKPSTSLAEEYGLSYKVSATRTYWTDSHGIQSDIIKLARSLRRIDRLDQFYADLRRISVYALACGYESFAPELAAILEKKSATTDPELKAHIAKATTALRTGGFKLIAGKDAH